MSYVSNLLPCSAELKWSWTIVRWVGWGGVGMGEAMSIHTTDQSRRKKRECMEEVQELNFSSWA